jgi:hypothetical protein
MRQNCSVQHVSQAPHGHTKCPADPHARRRPKREAEGREQAAAGHGNRGVILAGAALSPPGPQRIIAQTLGACGIQAEKSKVLEFSVLKLTHPLDTQMEQ